MGRVAEVGLCAAREVGEAAEGDRDEDGCVMSYCDLWRLARLLQFFFAQGNFGCFVLPLIWRR